MHILYLNNDEIDGEEVGIDMRTTVDISNDRIAKLRALAAQRGLRGYSDIIQEAIDLYLQHVRAGGDDLSEVLALAGSWSDEDVRAAEEEIGEFWGRWPGRS